MFKELRQLLAFGFPNSIQGFVMYLQSSQFNTDKTNRLGFHKFFRGYADKMWQNAKNVMKYIVQRGGRVGQSSDVFKITDSDIHGYQVRISLCLYKKLGL
jgi:Ferritin-like domain